MKYKVIIRTVVFLLMFGALFLATHVYLSGNPKKVAVIVDTSYDMAAHQNAVYLKIDQIFTQRYTEFSVFTDKTALFSWTQSPHAVRSLKFYGPEDFTFITGSADHKELNEADRIILISNSVKAAELKRSLVNLRIISI